MNQTDILFSNLWIFDLDGTLTRPQHDFKAIKARLEIPLDADILGHLSGLPQAIAREKRAQLDAIEIELARRAEPAPGVVELIQTLVEAQIQIAVLTRNSKENALQALAAIGLAPYFPVARVLGRDEALPKPDPQGIVALLKECEVKAEAALMVGDYLYDLQCARQAGVASVHVDGAGHFPWPEWTDLAVTDLIMLLALTQKVRHGP